MLPANIRLLWTDDRPRALVIASLFAMIAINQLGTGILTSVIPVQLAADGHSAAAAGLVSTAFSVTFLIGCIVGPAIAGNLGPTRTLLAVAIANATLACLHWAFPGPLTWTLFRGAGGLVTATYFIMVESWVGSQTTAATRGTIFGLYMVVIRLAIAAGQMTLTLVPQGAIINLCLAAVVAYLVSPLFRPTALGALPPMRRPRLESILELPKLAPAGAIAAFAHGCVFATIPGLFPKWAIDRGVTIDATASALTAIQLGGLLIQLPVSQASDRIERRTVMIAVVAALTVLSLMLVTISPDFKIVWFTLLFIWGGLASSLYAVGVAHANDLAPPDKRIDWVSSIMLVWGIGAAIGPLIAASLMDTHGVDRLWAYAATINIATAGFLLWRKVVRP